MDDVSDSNLIDCWQNGHSTAAVISSSAMRTASLQDGQLSSISLGIRKRKITPMNLPHNPKIATFSTLLVPDF